LCEEWEHVACMGSVAKRFMQLEYELSRVTDELHRVEAAQLASSHAVDTQTSELSKLVLELDAVKGERDELKCKVAQLTEQVDRLSRVGGVPPQPIAHDTSASIKVESDKSEESSTEDWSSSEDRSVASSATKNFLPSTCKLMKVASRSSPHPQVLRKFVVVFNRLVGSKETMTSKCGSTIFWKRLKIVDGVIGTVQGGSPGL